MLTGMIEGLNALVKQNGIIIIVVFVIVIHGFTTKILAWLNKKDETKEGEEEVPEHLQDNEDKLPEDLPPLADNDVSFIPYKPKSYKADEMLLRSKNFYLNMNARRSVRFFSDKDVPLEIIENIIHTAGTSPSGAHTEPWTYVVVKDPETKAKIQTIVEAEEEVNYNKRMAKSWVEDLKPFKTNWEKPYLSKVPYLILVYKQTYGITSSNERKTNYYYETSVGISCGLLLAAIQNAGLVTLTSTPLNCGPAIRELTNRGKNEKLLLLLPVGYPSEDCVVPDIQRKPLEEIMFVL